MTLDLIGEHAADESRVGGLHRHFSGGCETRIGRGAEPPKVGSRSPTRLWPGLPVQETQPPCLRRPLFEPDVTARQTREGEAGTESPLSWYLCPVDSHGSGVSVADAAREVAPQYRPFLRYSKEALQSFSSAILESSAADKLLVDVGAGTCTPTTELAPHFARALAVDTSPDMLLAAPASQHYVKVVGRGELLPIAAGCADTVTFFESLHLMEVVRALKEATRVLVKPGGTIAIVDTLKEDLPRQVFHQHFQAFHEFDRRRHWSLAGIVTACSDLGMRLTRMETADFVLEFESADSLTAFMESRPFFGLRQLSDAVFNDGLREFRTRVRERFGGARIASTSRSSLLVFKFDLGE